MEKDDGTSSWSKVTIMKSTPRLAQNRQEGREIVKELVARFDRNAIDYLRPAFNETQARTSFITPLLAAFGWDVFNFRCLPVDLREVIEEATVEVGSEKLSKRPDYELRLARQRKLFVEAKKPHVQLSSDKSAAFQIRRYGYSAGFPISVLTNFNELVIYDCSYAPNNGDHAHVARTLIISYQEYENRFDELWDIFSRETIFSGVFDKRHYAGPFQGAQKKFDDYFIEQIRMWRAILAKEFHANNPNISAEELTYVVQLFISRLVFLRICEDREIEKYETLRNLSSQDTFKALIELLQKADEFYNSGIFRTLNETQLGLSISDEALGRIIADMYYPLSPYTFSVVEAEVLGEIYEILLGEEICIDNNGDVSVVLKPEVRISGGVIPTPEFIVDSIVARTLSPILAKSNPQSFATSKFADICCGSGVFLLSTYDQILNAYLDWYVSEGCSLHNGKTIFEASPNNWRLTFEEKRRILKQHIFGVDIDPNAVEIAKFSLLLKLIERESYESLKAWVSITHSSVLPSLDDNIKCGNSLISPDDLYLFYQEDAAAYFEKVNPFDWESEFPTEMVLGGFAAIVGNPPYIRIQHMVSYSPEEVGLFQSQKSRYITAHIDNFDKYALFIERSIELTAENGRIGMIVPNKFMTLRSGLAIRELLSSSKLIDEITHFGTQQIFGSNVSNYTCILVMDKQGCDNFSIESVPNLGTWKYGNFGPTNLLDASCLTSAPWSFMADSVRTLFDRIRANSTTTLKDIADIFVGVQTSADDIYIIEAKSESTTSIEVKRNGKSFLIEKDLLKPCLHDVQISSFEQPAANRYMIFPYMFDEAGASLIQPTTLKSDYPGAWAYLNACKIELMKRKVAGGRKNEQQWYQYGRSQSLTKFVGDKIVLPILSLEPRYGLDRSNIVVTGGGNGPYYLIRLKAAYKTIPLEYLLAVLNNSVCEAMVRSNTSVFRGGYYSHGKQFIQDLPIPNASENELLEISQLVRELSAQLEQVMHITIPHQQTKVKRQIATQRMLLDKRVFKLFGLSQEEVDIVRSVPIPQ